MQLAALGALSLGSLYSSNNLSTRTRRRYDLVHLSEGVPVPTTERVEVEALRASADVKKLFEVLNLDREHRVPGWSRFVSELKEDLSHVQHARIERRARKDRRISAERERRQERRLCPERRRHGTPEDWRFGAVAPGWSEVVAGIHVPRRRFVPPFSFSSVDFDNDLRAIVDAIAARQGLWLLAASTALQAYARETQNEHRRTPRPPYLERTCCTCGRYFFATLRPVHAHCSTSCRVVAHRQSAT